MDPRKKLFLDSRLLGVCAFCGGPTETKDHVPPRVLLDKPYPSQLPTVSACAPCNQDSSLDEEYLACFAECAACGTTDPSLLQRANVVRILQEKPSLLQAVRSCRLPPAQLTDQCWEHDDPRMERVFIKLARGHVAFEFFPRLDPPSYVDVFPLSEVPLDRADDSPSMATPPGGIWPEIGTRAFLRAAGAYPDSKQVGTWIVVQADRYRYSVTESHLGILVQIVVREHLGGIIHWE